VPLARAALQAELPVVVDKPMATGSAEARDLADEARQRGLLLTVFQNRRWDGDFLTVRRLVGEGALGAVRRFESRVERWNPVPKACASERRSSSWRDTHGGTHSGREAPQRACTTSSPGTRLK
jgi:predicted dehydrogenase